MDVHCLMCTGICAMTFNFFFFFLLNSFEWHIKLILFDPLISGPWMVGLFPDVLYAVYHLIADTSEISPDQSCILIYSHCKHCFYDFLKIN